MYNKVAISNFEHKTVEPFFSALGSFAFHATYVGKDGKTHDIYTDNVKLKVEDQNGKEVLVDKSGNIPIDKLGDYKITYTFVNPDDTSKKTEKIVEFTVNKIILPQVQLM